MANATTGISHIPSFPQFRLFSTYACALPLLQSAILNMDKMVDILVRQWLQRANDLLSYRFSKIYFLLFAKCLPWLTRVTWTPFHQFPHRSSLSKRQSVWHASFCLIPTAAPVWQGAVFCIAVTPERNKPPIVACIHFHLTAFRATCLLLIYGQKPPGVLNFVLTMKIKGRPIIK